MRIYDTFIFYNELDLLEARLRELENSKVHKHIIVEGDHTFQGEPKPMYFWENRERFAQWADRIVYVTAVFRDSQGTWERQSAQRQCIGKGLIRDEADPDDLVLYSDLDEIPGAESLEYVTPGTVYLMNQHLFAVDWWHPRLWLGTTAERMGDIRYFDDLRDKKLKWGQEGHGGGRLVSGWHFSWLGGVEAIKDKARAYAHTELTDQICTWADQGLLYEQGFAWHADVRQLEIQQADITPDLVAARQWPQWIMDRECPKEWFHPILGETIRYSAEDLSGDGENFKFTREEQ